MTTVDVTKYGAKADGVTDDTYAIRRAITAAAGGGGGEVVFPTATYLVKGTIPPTTGVALTGNGSTLVKPSSSSTANLVYSGVRVSGWAMRGFVLKSRMDKPRVGYTSQLSSNVMGIQLSNHQDCILEDILFDGVEYGAKFDTLGYRLTLHNLKSVRCPRPLYLAGVNGGSVTDLDFDLFDAPGTFSKHVYVNDASNNLTIERVRCVAGGAWAVQVCSNNGGAKAHDIVVRDVTLVDCVDGCVVTDGAYNVRFENVHGSFRKYGLGLHDPAAGVVFDGFNLTSPAGAVLKDLDTGCKATYRGTWNGKAVAA